MQQWFGCEGLSSSEVSTTRGCPLSEVSLSPLHMYMWTHLYMYMVFVAQVQCTFVWPYRAAYTIQLTNGSMSYRHWSCYYI